MARELRWTQNPAVQQWAAKKMFAPTILRYGSFFWWLANFSDVFVAVSFQNGTKIQRVDGHSSDRCEHVRYSCSNNHSSVENDPPWRQDYSPKKT